MAKLDSSKCYAMTSKGLTMRKFIIPLLLASAAASPVMAQDQSDREERRARASAEREERQKAREERQQQSREERQQAPEQPQPQQQQQPAQVEQPRPDRGDRQQRVRHRDDGNPAAIQQPAERQRIEREQIERQRGNRQTGRQRIEQQQIDRQRFDRRGDQAIGQAPARDARQRIDARRAQWDQQRSERLARQERIRNSRPPAISPTPRPGTQPPPPPVNARPVTNPPVNWSSNRWRKDRRYDWYKHRNRYWWLFQLGWYNDPFGWGYQPYGIGWRMWPSYYSRSYWLDDPWQYRLPYAPAGTRWIRYWDDAVLVDLWSGQVIDVVYNFFW